MSASAVWIVFPTTQDCRRQKIWSLNTLIAIVQFTSPRQTRQRQDCLVVSGGRCELGITACCSKHAAFATAYTRIVISLSLCRSENSVENTYFTFFFRFHKRAFLRFLEMTCQKVVRSLVLNPSKSLSDHCNSFQLFICQSSVFEDLQTFITHTVLSFFWMWALRPHFWAKTLDAGDLPVLTFGNAY